MQVYTSKLVIWALLFDVEHGIYFKTAYCIGIRGRTEGNDHLLSTYYV